MFARCMLAAIAGAAAAHFASAGLDPPAQSQYCAWLVMLSVIVLTTESAVNPIGKAPWISPPTKPRRSFGTISSASFPKGCAVARFLNC
jgi:hypothetical protein